MGKGREGGDREGMKREGGDREGMKREGGDREGMKREGGDREGMKKEEKPVKITQSEYSTRCHDVAVDAAGSNTTVGLTAYLARKYGHHPFFLPNSFKSFCRKEDGRAVIRVNTDQGETHG